MLAWIRIIIVAALVACGGAASALEPDQFDAKLKQYDPEAVAAALSYARSLNVKETLTKAVPLMRDGLARQLAANNPTNKREDIEAFLDAFFQAALVEKADVIEKATLLIALDTMTKEELVAIAQFYATPIGQSILKKMPIMMGRMPELQALMMTHIVPDALRIARDKMKARGVEFRI
jgi:hypothetical protein